MMRLIFVLILVLFLIGANASNAPQTAAHYSALQDNRRDDQEFPVIYGKKDDGFPVSVNLRGLITKTSFTPDCGFTRGAGVLQIKLARSSPGYNGEYMYVAAACLLGWEGDDQYPGREVCMTVKKMKPGETCGADRIRNTIDSQGVPFYCLSWQSAKYKEFLKQVECK